MRKHPNVICVAKCSLPDVTLQFIGEVILERNHINVMCVERPLLGNKAMHFIRFFILDRSLGQTYLLVLEGLLWRRGWLRLTLGAKTLLAVVLGSTHWHGPSWRLPLSRQDLAPSNSLYAPVWDAIGQTANKAVPSVSIPDPTAVH